MAGIYNFTIEQGVRFTKNITWKSDDAPVDLTGMTARMEIRTRDGDLIIAPTCTTGEDGEITVSLTTAQTVALDFGTAVYDLEITQAGEVIARLLKGVVTLDRETTEDA